MSRIVAVAAIVVICIVELVLALAGPMAFVQKPSVLVARPYSYRLSDDEVDRLVDHMQRSLARTRLVSVISHRLIEDYFFEKQDDPDFTLDRALSYNEYRDLAAELGIERIAVMTAYPSDEGVSFTVSLRVVDSNATPFREMYISPDVDAFIAGIAIDASRFSLTDDLRIQTRGVGLFDNLFFVWLAGELAVAAVFFIRRRVDVLNEVVLVLGLLLALFAFVYAKNANMDYVQRLIAEKGQLHIAQDTATEQLRTALRFLPLLVANLALYIVGRLRWLPDLRPPAERSDGVTPIASRWGLAGALLSALLYALAFPSFVSLRGAPVLAWVALVPLLLAISCAGALGRSGRRTAQAIFYGIAFGALQTLVLNYWHGVYSSISLAFSVLISSVLYAAFFAVFAPLYRASRRWGFLVAPVLWVAFEFIRTQFYIGYPWGLIAVSQYRWLPVIQAADVTGIWGIAFVVVLVNASIAHALLYRSVRLPAAVSGGALVLLLSYGVVRMAQERPGPPTMRIVLAQQNTDPRKDDYRLSLTTLEELTRAAFADTGDRPPDLIVWPEGGLKTDVRYWLDRPDSTLEGAALARDFLAFAESTGTWLVTGTQDHTYVADAEGKEERRNFNSSLLLDGGTIVGFYHKIHLVPFTESFPFADEYPALADLLDKFDTSNWLAGDERTIFHHPKADFFTPICFEDIFPDDIRRFVAGGADLIVNMSNDFWSLTPVEAKQHAVHALFRAVENRRPMVRATASGLTTYIDRTGRLAQNAPDYYTAAYLVVEVPVVEDTLTFYSRHGDWFALAMLVASGLVATGLVATAITGSVGRARLRDRKQADHGFERRS